MFSVRTTEMEMNLADGAIRSQNASVSKRNFISGKHEKYLIFRTFKFYL